MVPTTGVSSVQKSTSMGRLRVKVQTEDNRRSFPSCWAISTLHSPICSARAHICFLHSTHALRCAHSPACSFASTCKSVERSFYSMCPVQSVHIRPWKTISQHQIAPGRNIKNRNIMSKYFDWKQTLLGSNISSGHSLP